MFFISFTQKSAKTLSKGFGVNFLLLYRIREALKIKGEKQIFMAAAIRCVCPKMRGVLEHVYELLAHSWRKVAKVQVHSHCFASGTFYNDNDNRYQLFRQDISYYFLIFF